MYPNAAFDLLMDWVKSKSQDFDIEFLRNPKLDQRVMSWIDQQCSEDWMRCGVVPFIQAAETTWPKLRDDPMGKEKLVAVTAFVSFIVGTWEAKRRLQQDNGDQAKHTE